MRSLFLIFLSISMSVSVSASHAGEISTHRIEELENLVLQDCGSCHGLTRKGGLGPDIRADTLAGYQPDGLASIIKYGIDDTAMPPWGLLLSDEDINWIAQYLLKDPPA